jgi:hypothetical protein
MNKRGIGFSGLLTAGLGAALGLREAGTLLTDLAARAAGFGPGPAPRGIEWIAATAGIRGVLQALDGVLLAATWLLGAAVLWRLVRLLNPDGTLLAPGAAVAGSLPARMRAPLERPLVNRCFVAAGASLYLFGVVRFMVQGGTATVPPLSLWGLSALSALWPGRPVAGVFLAFLLGGALFWLFWGEWGAVTPRVTRLDSVPATLLRGLLAGAAAFPAMLPLTPWGRSVISEVLAGAGLRSAAAWCGCSAALASALPLAFLLLGCAGHALAQPRALRPNAGLPIGAGAFIVLALLGGAEAFVYRSVAQGRYDHGGDLATLVGAASRPSSARAYLILTPTPQPLAGAVPYMSIQRIDAGDDSPRHTWEYMRRREFQSALAFEAFVHLHDCASLNWDSAESLRVDLANLEQNPQPVFANLLLEKLFTCAVSPENRAFLRQAADPARFPHTPGWLRTLGLAHHRFGDWETATRMLRQAGVSSGEIEEALGDTPVLTTGVISGRITINGSPRSRLAVGLLPADRWRTLVGTPRPFELRWVAASTSTDREGRFRLDHLGGGDYLLIVMGDPARLPLRDSQAEVKPTPGVLRLDSERPSRDVGTVEIRLETRESMGA